MAIGMARAALLIDEGCGIAKLVQANASGDSQDALLSEASEMSLSSDERLWLELMQSDEPWQPAATAIVESGNEAAFFPGCPLGIQVEVPLRKIWRVS